MTYYVFLLGIHIILILYWVGLKFAEYYLPIKEFELFENELNKVNQSDINHFLGITNPENQLNSDLHQLNEYMKWQINARTGSGYNYNDNPPSFPDIRNTLIKLSLNPRTKNLLKTNNIKK